MSDDDDDYDGEKTQIWLPGGGGSPAAPDQTQDREGIQLKPKPGADPMSTNVDFDITSGGESTTTTQERASAPTAPPAAQPAGTSSFGLVAIVVLIGVVAGIAYALFR